MADVLRLPADPTESISWGIIMGSLNGPTDPGPVNPSGIKHEDSSFFNKQRSLCVLVNVAQGILVQALVRSQSPSGGVFFSNFRL